MSNLLKLSIHECHNHIILDNMLKLTYLKITDHTSANLKCRFENLKILELGSKEINIFNINIHNLQTVILYKPWCGKKEQYDSLMQLNNVKYLKINIFIYDNNIEKRLFEFRCHIIAVEGEFKLNKLIPLTHLTHLILINNRYTRNVGGLKNLEKLTLASDYYHKKGVVTESIVRTDKISILEARRLYSSYLMAL